MFFLKNAGRSSHRESEKCSNLFFQNINIWIMWKTKVSPYIEERKVLQQQSRKSQSITFNLKKFVKKHRINVWRTDDSAFFFRTTVGSDGPRGTLQLKSFFYQDFENLSISRKNIQFCYTFRNINPTISNQSLTFVQEVSLIFIISKEAKTPC